MSSRLPSELQARLDLALEGVSRNELGLRSARLTRDYRATGKAVMLDRLDALTYASVRMPATFAALSHALGTSLVRKPSWQPGSMLDLGSGPGTAVWAARQLWPALTDVVTFERDLTMLKLAAELDDASAQLSRRQADISDPQVMFPRASLVIAAYVLGELLPAAQHSVLSRAWASTADMLVLVEPGTPQGASRIGRARETLLAADAHLLAPCPNQLPCPMLAPDWCHFPARLERSRAHKDIKGADVPFEDEKFAYLAVSRQPVPSANAGRIVDAPEHGKPGVRLRICADGAIRQTVIAGRDKQNHRAARKLDWGDLFSK